MLPRLASAQLTEAATVMPVVIVMGARQTGKSTLVQTTAPFSSYRYVTLDSAAARLQARDDPASLLRSAPQIVIDEVQRDPDLVLALKELIDQEPTRTPGRFVLTGSANLLAMRPVRDTLAGRASYTTLWPMTRRERLGLGRAGIWDQLHDTPVAEWPALVESQSVPADDWRTAALSSGYPTPALQPMTAAQRAVWFRGYLDTYLDRDIVELRAIAKPLDLNRLMQHVCLSIGQPENQSGWGLDTGMKRMTVSRYLDLLQQSFQYVRIPAYTVNRTKRLTKSPKVYWSDTGLALFLAGITVPTGFHLENMVVTDLLAWQSAHSERPQVMHWRTTDQTEVDIVIEFTNGMLLPIEIKGKARPDYGDTTALRLFLTEYPAATGGIVLHGGTKTYWLADRILAAPWWRVV
jgi:predicted AAA+ superfamily ATPase